ncbi:signal transducer and activator of transcription B-like [Eriocheir sinensis]|uniref:signal transducer and activator of transcription B-like n=1 Tax=Eriocheir sinensis TaxID=95602 RepID=UPI0021C62141|nr:signal transducer and activator of transcription B-like [Eriocheir sinensis]
MWMLRGQVVLVVVVVVVSAVSAAPGFNQGQQLFSNIGNGIGFSTNNNNNNLNNNYNNNNYNSINSGYSTNSLGYSTGSSGQQRQQSFSASDQQYPETTGQYGFSTTSPEQKHNSYTSYGTGTAAVDSTASSPALSALALLGFLYFLNLIQDVLQNNTNGRKRRSLPLAPRNGKGMEEEEEEEEEGRYITSYLEEEPVKGGEEERKEEEEEEEEEEATGRSQGRVLRAFSFLEDFFIRLPQALGMRKRQMIDRMSADGKPLGVSGFLASRLQMISSIMSFLQDPSPSRIRRSAQDIEAEEAQFGKGESESFPLPSLGSFVPLLVEVFKEYSPFNFWSSGGQRAFPEEDNMGTSTFLREETELKEGVDEAKEEEDEVEGDEGRGARRRRHSPTAMNAWYNELGGRNKEPDGGVGGVAAKAISLLGGGDGVQQAVKQEAAPALLELSKGLTGAHPHCLQRVLCRLTSHAGQLSLLPRVALQMLSSNMKNESEAAMKAGLRGENCSQTFSECDTARKPGKK